MDVHSSKESGITVLDSNGSSDRMAARNIIYEHDLSRRPRISIEGYNTSVSTNDIRTALMKHFGACGGIFAIKLAGDNGSDAVEGTGFIYFREEGSEKKALALDGTDMGGWNVVVKASPKLVSKYTTGYVAALKEADHRFTCSTPLFFRGYDTSLPADDVKTAVIKHFSSCVDITNVNLPKSKPNLLRISGVIYVYGEGAEEKALALNGSDVGGWNVHVYAFPKPKRSTPDPLGGVYA